MGNDNRVFEGIWIPAELWFATDISITEKAIFLEVKSMDNDFGCVASNKKIGLVLDIKPGTVSGILKVLEQKGYIEMTYKDMTTYAGRTIRCLKYTAKKRNPLQKSKGVKQESQGLQQESIHSNTISNSNSILLTDSKESVKKPLTVYQKIIEYWLLIYHPGWTFEPIHGKKVKSLITKFKKLLSNGNFEVSDDKVLELFKSMCQNMPEYYKDKDLAVIDSKFNEITTEIIKNKNGRSTQTNGRPKSIFSNA